MAGYRFKISDQSDDRDGDVVVSAGLQWDHYRANPVVFLNHKAAVPIGTSRNPETGQVDVEVDAANGCVYGTVHFAPTEEGQQVERLVKDGFLSAASIGFLPRKATPRPGMAKGLLIEQAEVTEWSVVGVPACGRCTRAKLADCSDAVVKALDLGDECACEKSKAIESPVASAGGDVLVSVFCPKAAFGGLEDATDWCAGKGYRTGAVTEKPDGWAFRQADAVPENALMTPTELDGGATGWVAKALSKPTYVPGPTLADVVALCESLKAEVAAVVKRLDGVMAKAASPDDDDDDGPDGGDIHTPVVVAASKAAPSPQALTPDQERRIAGLEGGIGNIQKLLHKATGK